jgi:hypothetical protein
MLSFAYQGAIEGDVWGRGGSQKGAHGWVRKQSIHSIGLVWWEVRILAQIVTTPMWFFLFFTTATHVLIVHCIYCKYAPVLFIFSPVQVKNKTCDRVTGMYETCIYSWARLLNCGHLELFYVFGGLVGDHKHVALLTIIFNIFC